MTSECRRHRLPSQYDPASGPYYVKRCAHFGELFVVEIRNGSPLDGGFVDYVEDMADGDVIVEGHAIMSNIGGAYPEPAIWEDRADALWEELTARMLAGDAPDPERGD